MTSVPPPAFEPDDVAMHHALIFQAWQCALGDERVTYLSGPITTGRRWIDAVEAGQFDTQAEVIAANSQDLLVAATELRANSSSIVIEPASLSVRGWSQGDYLTLWTDLIERHAGEVRFLEGWAYSSGCAHEFERALRHGLPTLAFDGAPISPDLGRRALRDARDRLVLLVVGLPGLAPLHAAIDGVVTRLESAV